MTRANTGFPGVVRLISNQLLTRPCCNTGMPAVAWSGVPPDREALAALRERGIAVERTVTGGLPLVVSTASARRVPAPAWDRQRWIWLAAGHVDDRRAMDAIGRGAYDVVARTAPDAVASLLRRLDELLTPDPIVRPPASLVTA